MSDLLPSLACQEVVRSLSVTPLFTYGCGIDFSVFPLADVGKVQCAGCQTGAIPSWYVSFTRGTAYNPDALCKLCISSSSLATNITGQTQALRDACEPFLLVSSPAACDPLQVSVWSAPLGWALVAALILQVGLFTWITTCMSPRVVKQAATRINGVVGVLVAAVVLACVGSVHPFGEAIYGEYCLAYTNVAGALSWRWLILNPTCLCASVAILLGIGATLNPLRARPRAERSTSLWSRAVHWLSRLDTHGHGLPTTMLFLATLMFVYAARTAIVEQCARDAHSFAHLSPHAGPLHLTVVAAALCLLTYGTMLANRWIALWRRLPALALFSGMTAHNYPSMFMAVAMVGPACAHVASVFVTGQELVRVVPNLIKHPDEHNLLESDILVMLVLVVWLLFSLVEWDTYTALERWSLRIAIAPTVPSSSRPSMSNSPGALSLQPREHRNIEDERKGNTDPNVRGAADLSIVPHLELAGEPLLLTVGVVVLTGAVGFLSYGQIYVTEDVNALRVTCAVLLVVLLVRCTAAIAYRSQPHGSKVSAADRSPATQPTERPKVTPTATVATNMATPLLTATPADNYSTTDDLAKPTANNNAASAPTTVPWPLSACLGSVTREQLVAARMWWNTRGLHIVAAVNSGANLVYFGSLLQSTIGHVMDTVLAGLIVAISLFGVVNNGLSLYFILGSQDQRPRRGRGVRQDSLWQRVGSDGDDDDVGDDMPEDEGCCAAVCCCCCPAPWRSVCCRAGGGDHQFRITALVKSFKLYCKALFLVFSTSTSASENGFVVVLIVFTCTVLLCISFANVWPMIRHPEAYPVLQRDLVFPSLFLYAHLFGYIYSLGVTIALVYFSNSDQSSLSADAAHGEHTVLSAYLIVFVALSYATNESAQYLAGVAARDGGTRGTTAVGGDTTPAGLQGVLSSDRMLVLLLLATVLSVGAVLLVIPTISGSSAIPVLVGFGVPVLVRSAMVHVSVVQ